MKVESIRHDPIDGTDMVMTTVVINQVQSQCILARLMINALGRPGIDNDLEMIGSGDTWTIIWTQSAALIDNTMTSIMEAIA